MTTWAEFKRLAEEAGVRDEDEIRARVCRLADGLRADTDKVGVTEGPDGSKDLK